MVTPDHHPIEGASDGMVGNMRFSPMNWRRIVLVRPNGGMWKPRNFLNRDQPDGVVAANSDCLPYDWVYFVAVVSIIALTSLLVHFVLHRVVLRFIGRGPRRNGKNLAARFFSKYSLFTRLALVLQGVVVFVLAGAFLNPDTLLMGVIETVTHSLDHPCLPRWRCFSLLDATGRAVANRPGADQIARCGDCFRASRLVASNHCG